MIGTGLPISIEPADDNILNQTEIQKVIHRYQDVNKNTARFCIRKQQTENANIDNRKKLYNTATRNGLSEEIQSNYQKHPIGRKQQIEKKPVIEKFSDIFKNNTTIKDKEKNIQLKPG